MEMNWQEVFNEKLKELEINMHYLVKVADHRGYGSEKVDEVITEYYELSEVSASETQEPYEHVEKIETLIQKGNEIFESASQ